MAIINLKDFEERPVHLDYVLLDPNNPRFARERTLPDERIAEDGVQQDCMEKMKKYGIDDLKENIEKVGFLRVDKVVVRPIGLNKYVVVEGNRRIAALKSLKEEYEKGQLPELPKDILGSILRFEVVVYKGEAKDIAWIIQGLRHISGVRDWPLFQKAELLMRLVREKKIDLPTAAVTLGIGPKIAARLFRAYHGYSQAKSDEEYGSELQPDHFSYFDGAIFARTALQDWLDWDEKSKKFKNSENLKKFLSWMFKEAKEGEPKITGAMQLRDIIAPAMVYHSDLFKKFESDETMTANDLNYEIGKRAPINPEEWLLKLTELKDSLSSLPTRKIAGKKAEFIQVLKEIIESAKWHLKALGRT